MNKGENFGQSDMEGESDLPTWLRGPGVSEDIKDFFRIQKAGVDRYQESLKEKVDVYLDGIEKAITPSERRKIILTAMVIEQFERDISHLMNRPDPSHTPEQVMKQIEDIEKRVNALYRNIGLEPKYLERELEQPPE